MQLDKETYFKLDQTILATRMLIVFRNLRDDNLVRDYMSLLQILVTDAAPELAVVDAYHKLVHSLLVNGTAGSWPDAWQRYLVARMLEDENPFSLQAEKISAEEIESALRYAVKYDLSCLQKMFDFSAEAMKDAVVQKIGSKFGRQDLPEIPDWRSVTDHRTEDMPIAEKIYVEADWSSLTDLLISHYGANGCGPLSKYQAFRWERSDGLIGIANPDQPSIRDLIGLETQIRQLTVNTDYFVQGLPANNVLLYGKRGTGKSSLVKSLLTEYRSRGLRLVELPKQHLQDIPAILALLRNRAFYFILFIDDLSFEEYEVEYKELKAVLEGGIEAVPDNVLVYATSNRRHLIKEYFADRKSAEEIHHDDTAQEKQSIADRFGITILFPSTNQQSYLQIVEELALRFDLSIDSEDLKKRALQWEKSHNGPSGRTARQFVENLAAQFGVARRKIRKS